MFVLSIRDLKINVVNFCMMYKRTILVRIEVEMVDVSIVVFMFFAPLAL